MNTNWSASISTAPVPKRARRSLIWVAVGALVCGLLVGGVVALGSGATTGAAIAACADRQIVVSLSSSERTEQLQRFAVDTITQAAISAAVCNRALDAFGVAGGGQVLALLSSDDVARFKSKGPNRSVRVARLNPSAGRTIESLVADRLRRAYATDRAPSVSSVVALYTAAAEHALPDTDLIVVTDGVNHDNQVDLNLPLHDGDGQRLARGISVPRVDDNATTVVGIAQVDATIPVPGPSWLAEIRSFNADVCHRSGARRCRLFSIASVTEALNP